MIREAIKVRGLVVAAAALVALVLASVSISAQEDDSAAQGEAPGVFLDVLDIRVVNVDVFVTDKDGQPVVGLRPEDFSLEVDGNTMPISNFYAEVGGMVGRPTRAYERQDDESFRLLEDVEAGISQRAHMLIVVDHTRLGAGNRKKTFNALREMLDQVGDDVLISVVGIEPGLRFHSDFIYDRDAIRRILDDIQNVSAKTDVGEFERRLIFGELARGQSGGILARSTLAEPNQIMARIRAYADETYSRSLSTVRTLEQVIATMGGIPGRKGLVYVGEGIPTRPGEDLFVEWRNRFAGDVPENEIGMRHYDFNTDYNREVGNLDLTQTMHLLASAANRAGVTMYAIDAEGDHSQDVRSALTEQGATSETLSVVGENYRAPLEALTRATGGRLLRSPGRLAEEFSSLIRDFDTYYSIGFVPPSQWDDEAHHDIDVRVANKDLRVRHREDVRLVGRDDREAAATVAALMYQTLDNPMEVGISAGELQKREDGNAALDVLLEVPVSRIELIPSGDRHSGGLTIFVATRDAEGNPGKVQKVPFKIAIPDDVIDEAREDLAHYTLPLVIRPGDQQVAVGVRDDISGTYSSVRMDISEFSSL